MWVCVHACVHTLVCVWTHAGEQQSAAINFDHPNTDDPLHFMPLFLKKISFYAFVLKKNLVVAEPWVS